MKHRMGFMAAAMALAFTAAACALPGLGQTTGGSGACPGLSGQPAASGPGSYTGGDAYTTTQRGPIQVDGGACTGDVTSITAADNWTFEGKANQIVIIDAVAIGGTDPNLTLIDPAGNVIGQDDDSGGNVNARLVTTLPTAGVYTVRVDVYSEGQYNVSVKQGGTP